MKITDLISSNKKPTPKTTEIKWVMFKSIKLNDNIIFLIDKKYLKEARNMYPNTTIYFKQEIDELWNAWGYRNKDDDEAINQIHALKKTFNGWILPDKGE